MRHSLALGQGVGDIGGDLEAARARHADVEEDDVRRVFADQAQGVDSIRGQGRNAQLGPQFPQLRFELRREQRLVFGDERARVHAGKGRLRVTLTPPCALSARSSDAVAP